MSSSIACVGQTQSGWGEEEEHVRRVLRQDRCSRFLTPIAVDICVHFLQQLADHLLPNGWVTTEGQEWCQQSSKLQPKLKHCSSTARVLLKALPKYCSSAAQRRKLWAFINGRRAGKETNTAQRNGPELSDVPDAPLSQRSCCPGPLPSPSRCPRS